MKIFEKLKNILNKKIDFSFIQFVFLFSAFNLVVYSYPLFKKYYLSYNSVLLLFPIAIFTFLVLCLFYSLVVFKKYFKYIIGAILILNAVVYYYMLSYGIVFDVNMLINITETNYNEASEFFSIKPFVFAFFVAGIPLYFLIKNVELKFNSYWKKKVIATCSFILAILLVISPCYLFKKSKTFLKNNQRITSYIIPINYIGSVFEFVAFKIDIYWTSRNLIKISNDAVFTKQSKNDKPNLLVFMIGESARAKNFSLNGYERPTNEFLNDYKDEIITFKNFESCGTFTALSLTCTFSHLPRTKFDYSQSFKYESLIDIFDKVGFDIYWKSNNGKCKNVCKRVKNSLVKSFGTEIYDDLLIKVFNSDIKQLIKENNLIFLHGRGSHGPLYFNRYPKEFEIFKPACNDEIQNCKVKEIVNAYDNTIYYTSYLVKDIIDKLKSYENKYNVAFIFMSDHGQSLGEDGIFMHSAPFDKAPIDQKNPAFFIWFSQGFADEFNIDLTCLKNKSNEKLSQDNIFHSMLGLFGVNSMYYEENLDMFKSCIK